MDDKQPKSQSAKDPIRIDDLPETTPGSQDANVKGGMISGGFGGEPTDEYSDELGGGE